ncbi:MAG: Uncharacterized protein Athens071425_416 [Parcubacteria group bacterium Athens0714_25]|nr:MAG: Uncharacterized protein Athens071425_416 [Parcubacteria group bacterium Athens0714_25]
MIRKLSSFLKNNWFVLLISVIFLVGIFLRSFHFSDWMHFELDQERDAHLISKAIENGPAELPLLGPRASGSFLRLGPVFYYLEYLSALAFGNTPQGIAGVVLLFSIASLPLFFYFFRIYFDRRISLMLLSLYAVSLYFVMYSRFAWNPNLLPFFILLFFYSLLRIIKTDEKNKGKWLLICSFSLAITTQLHFVAFISLPVIFAFGIIFKRTRINWRYWLGFIFILLLFYSPMIINEYKTGGENAQEFFKAITEKSGDGENVSIVKKAVIDYIKTSRYYSVLLTGRDDSDFLRINFEDIKNQNTNCKYCWRDFPLGIMSSLFFLVGIWLSVWIWRKESDEQKKDFILLNLVWIFFVFLLFVPLALEISPRFFLLSAFSPFFLLGVVLNYFFRTKKAIVSWIIFLILISLGIQSVKMRFNELSRAPFENIWSQKDVILKEKKRVTLEQEEMIIAYMEKISRENGEPIFFEADPEYSNAFEYFLEKNPALFDDISSKNIYRQGNYFSIQSINSLEEVYLGKLSKKFTLLDATQFGTLTVVRMQPKEEAITEDAKDFNEPPKKKSRSKAPKRYVWREIFDQGFINEDDEDE